jgi:protease-4
VLNRIVAGPTIAALRRLADDKGVKAVVIRIDSPGGSALASDRVWHAVRRVAAKKPVAISVGNMAASGGYYIASAGSRVFASPASLVGSIGVVGGKVSVAKMAQTHGVHVDELSRGPRAAWLSPFSPFTDGQRAQLEHLLQRTYRLFLHRIAVGRGLKVSELFGFTEGRIMTGRRAAQGRLVDELGGLTEAFAWVRSEANLPDAIAVETWPTDEATMAALTGMLGGLHAPVDGARLRALLIEAAPGPIPAWVRSISAGQHAATALPWHLSVQ